MEKKMMTDLTHLGLDLPDWENSTPKIGPIWMSPAFVYEDAETLEAVGNGSKQGYLYGRTSNPTNDALREILTGIDGGKDSQVYSSGMAAISLAVMTHVKSGDHIIVNKVIFGTTYKFFRAEMRDKFNVEVSFVNFKKDDIESYFKPNTKLVYMETIANPLIDLIDIRKIADMAHKHDCMLIVDNTFATPVVCQPLTLGADIVAYSATKFMNGHSDIIAGTLATNSTSIIEEITDVGHSYGPIMSPFDAWLMTRSLRTLKLRMVQHCNNAMKVAKYFEGHDKAVNVFYPGLESSPDHKLATEIFNNGLFGGMLSVDLGTEDIVREFIRNLKMVKLVPSLGCLTTTVSDIRTSHGAMSPEERAEVGLSDGVLRFSIGLEEIDDVIEDIDNALSKI